jgi:hypothetical protein
VERITHGSTVSAPGDLAGSLSERGVNTRRGRAPSANSG